MAAGNPKFGGSGGVPPLDIGQVGGTRESAQDAKFSGQVIRGADRSAKVRQNLPQQNISFIDNLGFDGSLHTWSGTLFVKTDALMNTILQEINQRNHGSLRDATSGVLEAPDPSLLKETLLTDFNGDVLSTRAILRDVRPRGRRLRGTTWPAIQEIDLVFEVLG